MTVTTTTQLDSRQQRPSLGEIWNSKPDLWRYDGRRIPRRRVVLLYYYYYYYIVILAGRSCVGLGAASALLLLKDYCCSICAGGGGCSPRDGGPLPVCQRPTTSTHTRPTCWQLYNILYFICFDSFPPYRYFNIHRMVSGP